MISQLWIISCMGHIHPQVAQAHLAKAVAACAVVIQDSSTQAAQKVPWLLAPPASSLLVVQDRGMGQPRALAEVQHSMQLK